MVRHHNKSMKLNIFPVMPQSVEKEQAPAIMPEKGLPSRRLKRDKVGLTAFSEHFALGPHISLKG